MQVSDKETRAVFLNFKELRCLEKNIQALDLEKAYSVSLINLDKKVVKVRDKKTRDRVMKIKSHLSQNDIEEMKTLDDSGKLGIPESSSKLNSSLRIAAAAKRLKLLPRAKSAVPRLSDSRYGARSPHKSPRSGRSPITDSTPKTPVPAIVEPDDNMSNYPVPRSVRNERRNSIAIKLPDDEIKPYVPKIAFVENSDSANANGTARKKDVRDKSPISSRSNLGSDLDSDRFYLKIPGETGANALTPQTPSTPKSPRPNNTKIRPVSVPATQISDFGKMEKIKRPSTTNAKAMEARRKSFVEIRRASTLIKSGRTTIPFSSHEKRKKKSDLEQPYRATRDGGVSAINLDTKDNDVGNELFKAIKQGILMGEVANSLYIEDKIDNFFANIDTYKQNNPTHFEPTVLTKTTKGKKKDSDAKPKRNELRRRELQLQLQDVEARTKLADEMWKNVNKCRYLRVADEDLDLSGINTLAIDQLKMQKKLQQGNID